MKPFIEAAHDLLNPWYTPREINRICRLLLEKRAGLQATSFYADKDTKIPSSVRSTLQEDIQRLAAQEPLEYVLGEAHFDGLVLKVDKRVLIPRPETEELVDWISKEAEATGVTPTRILDACTGSGCIALDMANRWPSATVEAWDVSTDALDLARENAERLGLAVTFAQRDVLLAAYQPFTATPFDLLVSNPPYVRASEATQMKPNVLEHEPHLALFVPDDTPLLFYKALAALGLTVLTPGGHLYVEINAALGHDTQHLFETAGYTAVTLKTDLYDKQRFIRAQVPTSKTITP
ncbi:MAG: peptide chain release factor N(5)-glutamine methyltransferase [Bacteroidales bacterium]|jgi:release factor glutamine methyltransferase|nr:peptide chain release factor N(5)-glutamine methyltransferase [Bacteroidales bacterium]